MELTLNTSIVHYYQHLRCKESLPKAGFRELFITHCKQCFGERFRSVGIGYADC
ncbi:hypothetical protein PGTDC60_0541 [Porphyromonas gingivalis TDC60]|nr:hypothetical protein PGTDC60_0541 [Porphyromonas gingivalis TDC60]